MSALTDLIASLPAGGWGTLHLITDATNGYAASVDSAVSDGINGAGALSQSTKCVWDWTPWRTYGSFTGPSDAWLGYLVNHAAGYTAGTTSIAVDTGTKKVTAGDLITFQNVPGVYTVVTGFAGGSGTVTITPALAFDTLHPGPLVDNAHVTITHSGRRMFTYAHSHSAGANSWPSWCCYEEYDNTWKPLAAYHHMSINNDDVVFDDILYGQFHQCSGISLNPARQIFYRGYTQNPMAINRININEFDPTDIGKFTVRALTGTVTMVNGSQTVTGVGTLFNTQVQQGDQIWLNGDETFHGLPLRLLTVSSVQTNTSLTCYNQYQGTAPPGAASAQDAYDLETHWGFEPSILVGSGICRPSLEYWPERDSLIAFNGIGSSSNGVYEKRAQAGAHSDWTLLFTYPQLDGGDNGGDVMGAFYNPLRRCILLLIGQKGPPLPGADAGDGGLILYELKCTSLANPIEGGVTLTRLDDMPLLWTGGRPGGGLTWADPITGKYYFVGTDYTGYPNPPYGTSPYLYGEIDASQPLLSQFTQLDGSVIPPLHSSGTITVNTACGVMWDLGAVLFMTNQGVKVHKPSANNRANLGLTSAEKGNMPGAVGSVRWGDNFTPIWTNSGSLDPIYLTAMSGRALGGIDQYRTDGQANLQTINYAAPLSQGWVGNSRPSGSADGTCIPDIDTGVVYKSQPGSLRLTRPRMVADNVGNCQVGFDGGIGTGHNHKIIHPAHYGLSANIYIQYPLRVNQYLLKQYAAGGFTATASISSAGSTTVFAPADGGTPNLWTAGHVGQYVYFNELSGDARWIPGFYQVISVPSPPSSTIVLDRCPVISGNTATGGSIYTQTLDPGSFGLSNGFKTDLLIGNAPFAASSSTEIEITTVFNNKDQSGGATTFFPQMYGLQGHDGYGDQNVNGPLVADVWNVYDKTIRLNPAATMSTASGRRGKRWGDWTSGGAGSLRIHSNAFAAELIADAFWFASGWIFISGYGPRTATVSGTNWVTGLYLVDHVDAATGELVLTTSPTPSGAGSEGEIWTLSKPSASGRSYVRHEAELRVNGPIAVLYNHPLIRLAPGSADPEDRYGPAQILLSIFHTSASASYDPGGTAFAYYGAMTTATQPIPYLTADSVPSEATTGVRFFRHQVRR